MSSLNALNYGGMTEAMGQQILDALNRESVVLTKGTVTGLADSVLTTVVTFVAGANTRISHISCSGDGEAEFSLYVNTAKKDAQLSTTMNLSQEFRFNPMFGPNLNDVIEVKVINQSIGHLKNFEVTIYGV